MSCSLNVVFKYMAHDLAGLAASPVIKFIEWWLPFGIDYRPPKLLLGATDYGVDMDLWSAYCILAELLAGRAIIPGRTELPHAAIFKPQQSYTRCLAETFKEFPPSSLPLIETLLAIDPVGYSSIKQRSKLLSPCFLTYLFMTKAYACDPSSLARRWMLS
ncbi:hypothetical protein GQ457_14G014170 [Hibiscus cannabinus]